MYQHLLTIVQATDVLKVYKISFVYPRHFYSSNIKETSQLLQLIRLFPTYFILLKTELRISHFQHFHWLSGYSLSAHIPVLPNMVNENVMKYRKLDENFPSTPAAIRNRLAAELTSRYSDLGTYGIHLFIAVFQNDKDQCHHRDQKVFLVTQRKFSVLLTVQLLVELTFTRKSL